jgi:hypothetical protein
MRICFKNCAGRTAGVIISAFALIVGFCPFVYSEIITFRSGKIIQADVLRKTNSFIAIKKGGSEVKYLLSDIESILDESIGLGENTTPLQPPYFSTLEQHSSNSLLDEGSILGDTPEDSMYRSFERNIQNRPPISNVEDRDRVDDMFEDVREDFDKHFLK